MGHATGRGKRPQRTRTRDRLTAACLHHACRLPGSRWATRAHAGLYRRTRGRAVRRWFGAPVLILEVRGRSTGRLRTVPLIYLATPEGYVVTAANAGDDRTPQWWSNLRAAGEGVVYVGGRSVPVAATVAEGSERDRLWRALVGAYPSVGEYTRYTDRVFPVVLLRPSTTADDASEGAA